MGGSRGPHRPFSDSAGRRVWTAGTLVRWRCGGSTLAGRRDGSGKSTCEGAEPLLRPRTRARFCCTASRSPGAGRAAEYGAPASGVPDTFASLNPDAHRGHHLAAAVVADHPVIPGGDTLTAPVSDRCVGERTPGGLRGAASTRAVRPGNGSWGPSRGALAPRRRCCGGPSRCPCWTFRFGWKS